MIAGLVAYPTYKDSGVQWLGMVPKQWDVQPALAVYKPRQVKNTSMIEKTVLSLSYGRIIVKPPDKLRGLVPESFETYQIVEPGNIIVRTTDLQNDQASLRIGHAKDRGIITSAYMCLETTGRVSNEFGYQYLNTYDLMKIIYGYGSGLRQNLDFSHIKRMPVLVPPPDEQAAIVRFLDHADRRIRRYIRAKQKLIKLLEAQKQAIIHRAVTRGLDPNVRLKPSGIEWLGDVPEHWEVVRVKQCARTISKGTTPSTEGREILDVGPVRFLKAENIAGGVVTDRPLCFIDDETNAILRRSQLKAGDVLFVIAGATLGKIAVVDSSVLPANTNQAVAFIRPNCRVIPEYLAMWLQSPYVKESIWLQAVQSAQPNLSMTDLGNFAAPIPPLDEQRDILAWLGSDTAELNATIKVAKCEIDLLREYRTRLIADVVTGKLDVRAAAASLSDEVEAVAELDEELCEDVEDTDAMEEGDE